MRDDTELLAACVRGDEQAFVEVHARYYRLVRSIAASYGLRESDIDDIEQTTFTIFHRSLARLRTDSRLAPWLSTVARRHVWRVLESHRRESAAEIHADTISHDDLRRHADQLSERDALVAALATIPSSCRQLLELLYLRDDEPSYTQIADELGMAVGSIGPTRSRCLDRLRRALDASNNLMNSDSDQPGDA